jgi:hypothetical protein
MNLTQSRNVNLNTNTGTGGSLFINAGANNVDVAGTVQYSQGVDISTGDTSKVTISGSLSANNATVKTGDIEITGVGINTAGGTTSISTNGNTISLNGANAA